MQTTSAVLTTAPQPGRYEIDAGRSSVTVATRHLFGLGRLAGSFAIRAGTLTVCGTTRPVTLAVSRCEASHGSFAARATTRIDRTESGITAASGLAARYLDLTVEVRCTRN